MAYRAFRARESLAPSSSKTQGQDMNSPEHIPQDGSRQRNPYVFAVGCARSGTTLLTRMLDAHPQIAMTPETHWIPKFFEPGADSKITPELLLRLSEYHRIRKLGLELTDLERFLDPAGVPTSYADFASRFFDLHARRAGKPLAGDKTPSYVRVIGFLHRLWPRLRFLHLLRDGRDVALSVRNWDKNMKNVGRFSTWSDEPLLTTAVWWAWNVDLGRAAGRALGPALYREIAYETLVADPERGCRDIAGFLDLEYDDAMCRFHEGRVRDKEHLSAKKAWLPPTQGLRDWRSQMSPDDVELFEAAAGDLLEELGYPRQCPAPGAAARKRAASVRERFEREAPAIDPRPKV